MHKTPTKALATRTLAIHSLTAVRGAGNELALALQMNMDRQAKANSALSNLLKAASDTSGDIVGNMK